MSHVPVEWRPTMFTLIDNIHRNRNLLVGTVFARLSWLQQDLLGDRKGCGIECRTMQLGTLTRLLNSTSLLNDSSWKDYRALSVAQLLAKLETAVCPTWYGMFDIKKHQHYYGHQLTHNPHECPPPGSAFHVTIKSIVDEVNRALRGLKITDYAKSAIESVNGAGKAIC